MSEVSFNIDIVQAEVQVSCEISRKRQKNDNTWKKNISKSLCNQGQSYISRNNGNLVAARKIGEPCKDGHFEKIGMTIINAVFKEFWELGDYDKQTAYLQKLIDCMPVKRRRAEIGEGTFKRQHTFLYKVMYNSIDYMVCKNGFCSIFGIGLDRVTYVSTKLTITGTPIADKRGKHSNSRRGIEPKDEEKVIKHIESLPTVFSHYTRAKSPHRKYLSSEFTITKCYDLYKEHMQEAFEGERIMTEAYYKQRFSNLFNIGIAPNRVDSCKTCVRLETNIKSELNIEKKKALEEQLSTHKGEANTGLQMLGRRKKGFTFEDPSTMVICFDLQQTLPTPKLEVGVAYYKRKLWTYNFCIHDVKKNESSMYVWDEVTAKRGSLEIVSCLKHYIDNHCSEHIQQLILFSDNCPGQNKNINMVLFCLKLIHEHKFVSIRHFFLLPGHSYMPCDRSFGVIEKNLRKRSNIYSKKQYIHLIKNSKIPAFQVFEMNQNHFYDVNILKLHVYRKSTGIFMSGREFEYSTNFHDGFIIKQSYNEEDLGTKINLSQPSKGQRNFEQHRTWNFDLGCVQLPKMYNAPIPLTAAKLKDIKELMHYIMHGELQYYYDIIENQNVALHPGNAEDAAGEDDVLIEYD